MHPGIFVLPLLACGLGVLLVRTGGRDEGRAACVYGLVAAAFLWPALSIPDGVPSPAASLFARAPWQGLADAPDPASGNGAIGDVTFQIQPWLLLLRDQVRRGELPLWNPYSFLGQPFWANGQSAPLFPLHLLFAALPTLWGFVLLPWLRILIGALGTRRLALAVGVGPAGALAAGLTYALSGMVTGYLLFPMGNALVLVPWVLWATERLVAGGGSVRALALCVGLLALAGHPGTLVHCALLSAIYLLVRGCSQRAVAAWTTGWAGGGALALAHLLPVALYLPQTVRWAAADALSTAPEPPPAGPSPGESAASLWLRVLPMAFRVIQPWAFGRAEDGTWHGAFYEPGSRVFVGLAGLVLALVALLALAARARRDGWRGLRSDRRTWALVALLAFSGLVAYQTPYLVQAVTNLPVVGKALHHRLIFGVELSLALLAGLGVDQLGRPGAGRKFAAACGLVLAAYATLVAYLARGASLGDVLAAQWPWLAWLAVAALVLWWLRRTPGRLAWLPALLIAAELVAVHSPSAPGLSLRQLYPPTGATDFLAGRPGAVAGTGSTLRPNTAMVYGLRDLRGDDPARPRRFDRMYRHLGSIATPFFHPVTDWRHAWLDVVGIRWVVTPPASDRRFEVPDPSWHLAYDGADARVFERPNARPEAFAVPEHGVVVLQRVSNRHLVLRGPRGEASRWVVTEAWAPGWRARLDDVGLGDVWTEAVAHDDFLLAVDLPAVPAADDAEQELRLDLVYRPPGLVAGAWVSLAALCWLAWPLAHRLVRRRCADRCAAGGRIRQS